MCEQKVDNSSLYLSKCAHLHIAVDIVYMACQQLYNYKNRCHAIVRSFAFDLISPSCYDEVILTFHDSPVSGNCEGFLVNLLFIYYVS